MIVLSLVVLLIFIGIVIKVSSTSNTDTSNSESNNNSNNADEKVYYELAKALYNHPNEDERNAICSQYTQSEIDSAKVVLKQMEESDEYRRLIFHLTDTVEKDNNPIDYK